MQINLKFFWRLSIGVFSLAGVLAAYILVPLIADPSTDFIDRKGSIANASQTRYWSEGSSRYSELTVTSTTGLNVNFTIRKPEQQNKPLPLAILISGYGTGRDAALLLPETPGIAIASLSYPYEGRLVSGIKELAVKLKRLQQAVRDTPPTILLALEYLLQQSYVDSERVELVGVSLGAFFVSMPTALDERIKRVWLIHGAGDPADIFSYQLRHRIESNTLRRLAGSLIATLIYSHHLKPELWVKKISPRSVMVINACGDSAFPQSSVNALHQSLTQPYEIIWTEGHHVAPDEQQIIQQLASLVFQRIASDQDGKGLGSK